MEITNWVLQLVPCIQRIIHMEQISSYDNYNIFVGARYDADIVRYPISIISMQ
jgi:hypothetical protein